MKYAMLTFAACTALPAFAQLSLSSHELLQTRSYAGEDRYARGTSLLDAGKYDEALRAFEAVQTGTRLEGALYWKAYCLNKLGRRDEAVAALKKLQQDFPSGRWADDAKALQAKFDQNAGKPAAEDSSNEELKLLAINGLLAADPDRAVPQIERLLKGNSSPRIKDRALFVLTQSGSPKAAEILASVARGKSNPDMQARAIRYIGMSGSAEAKKQLGGIYESTKETEVKKSIIRALMLSSAADQLLNIAKNEKDPELRSEAIRNLGMMHKTPLALYTPTADARLKRDILNGLFLSGDAKSMVDIAHRESDPEMKKHIVTQLSMMHSKEATDYMLEILK